MPVSVVHKTSKDNKGSSSKYGFYLNKENQEYIKNGEPEKQQFFFNQKNYANNFNKNISEKDIVWTAKIEHKRKFKGFEKEVENGNSKSGELKKGMQSHVHITVSRMHKDYRVNLSPLTNARSSNNLKFKGTQSKGGFDRSNWKQLNEESFDKAFNYKRPLQEKFETNRILKNGTPQEKELMKRQIIQEKIKENNKEIKL